MTLSGVGKFHEAAHRTMCRIWYSFHYIQGAGQTDGETLERIWASLNALATRTREMSSGHRHDVINYWHDAMNWRRTTGLGKSAY